MYFDSIKKFYIASTYKLYMVNLFKIILKKVWFKNLTKNI